MREEKEEKSGEREKEDEDGARFWTDHPLAFPGSKKLSFSLSLSLPLPLPLSPPPSPSLSLSTLATNGMRREGKFWRKSCRTIFSMEKRSRNRKEEDGKNDDYRLQIYVALSLYVLHRFTIFFSLLNILNFSLFLILSLSLILLSRSLTFNSQKVALTKFGKKHE